MGVFDLFGREPKAKVENREVNLEPRVSGEQHSQRGPVSIFSPTSYKDVEKIIDALIQNKTAIVHLENLKTETAIRVLDMLSGAIYAIGGGVYEMEKNIFMFSPNGIEVNQ